MTNFQFLTDDLPEFADDAKILEELVRFDPKSNRTDGSVDV